MTSREAGFSLTEMLVSSALLLVLVGAVVAISTSTIDAALTQPEAIDLDERLRAASTSLIRDLYVAGAGPNEGPLGAYMASVLPRRVGAASADPPAVARPDAVSIIWVPLTRLQTTMVAPFSMSPLVVRQALGCPITQPACGAKAGMAVALFDQSGTSDLFSADTVDTSGIVIRPRGQPSSRAYGDEARVVEVEARTYYFDAAARQLRRYDTDSTDSPVVDDVVGMLVEYFGSAAPPLTPKPAGGEANCLYDAAGNLLPGMVHLAPGADGMAPLPLEIFRDGPWCGAGGLQYDADLLRVRRVRVTLRLQVSNPALRGADPRFVNPGTARGASRVVPDRVSVIDVTPRNLELAPAP
jgi:prepilin-type N-terminal cleavage/methylation domain-containing protein